MHGDDKPLDDLRRELQELKLKQDETYQQLVAIKTMLEEKGYKVDSKR